MRRVWHTEYKNMIGLTTRTRDTYVDYGGGGSGWTWLEDDKEVWNYFLYTECITRQEYRIFFLFMAIVLLAYCSAIINPWLALVVLVGSVGLLIYKRPKETTGLLPWWWKGFDWLVSASDRQFLEKNKKFITEKAHPEFVFRKRFG